MCAKWKVSIGPMVELLRWAAPGRSKVLDDLIAGLSPQLQLDSDKSQNLFRADGRSNTITIGVECTRRLQAHAYAFGIAWAAQGTPGYSEMPFEVRKRLYSPADSLLSWAVSRDLHEWTGPKLSLEEIFNGTGIVLPERCFCALNKQQRVLGEGLFRMAIAFILLHELAHLHRSHVKCSGVESYQQEKDADRFAADWLVNSLAASNTRRRNCLSGIAVALLWETVFNVFLGPRQSETHPEGYDRLFQVLDSVIDPANRDEGDMVWWSVSGLLITHLGAAGVEIETAPEDNSPRGCANYLIDVIAKKSPW